MSMKTLIVDDNKMARLTLKTLAGRVSDIELVGECADAMEAYNKIREAPVDLLFLDIEMPGMSGLELVRNLTDNRPLIIFTTSKKDYAVDAFELNVADYIVKPVEPARFLQAIEKAKELLDSNFNEVTTEADEFIFIRDGNMVRRLGLEEILFAEAMGDYVKLHTAQKFHAVHATLRSVEERLPGARFLRVHRSYIIALDKIDVFRDGMLIIHEKPIPVADAYRNTLNKRMNIL